VEWTGSFENEQRAERRLAVVVPDNNSRPYFSIVCGFQFDEICDFNPLDCPVFRRGGLMALPVAGLTCRWRRWWDLSRFWRLHPEQRHPGDTRSRVAPRSKEMMESIQEGATSRVRPMVMTR